MNNSEDLDTFSQKYSTNDNVNMDTECYDSLVCRTKKALQYGINNEIKKATFSSFFSKLLEDCRACITQSFGLINNALTKSNSNVDKLMEYIDDSVVLLQMLSDFIKAVVELISLSCLNMKTFPTSTAHIIGMVFLHCKESDSLYDIYLSNVAKHLKELFRTCHELQLTYLMVIERHFVFDLSEKEQLNVLETALDINLEIGGIVEILDVKTMAEQWKGYTAICEKYSHALMDKPIYNKCNIVLCQIIENNIKTASDHSQEDKVITRAVKVSCFMIKILLKMISIFKHSTYKNQDLILSLLINLYLKSYPYNESEKCTQFTNLMHTNLLPSIEMLLIELLLDQTFVNGLLNYDINKIRKEDALFGYLLLLMSFMKVMIQFNTDRNLISKQKIICCVYNCLPHCHVWFNMGLKFNSESRHFQTEGFYEHVLTYMTAFTMTLTAEEYCALEQYMIEALLGTDCITALFTSNLWTLLAKSMDSQLLTNQLCCLCKIYRKSEFNVLFKYSPQKIHLSYTIRRLFEVVRTADKIKLYKEFSDCNENVSLLCLFDVQSLPENVRIPIEEKMCEKLKSQFRKLSSHSVDIKEMDRLNYYMDLVASCSFIQDNGLVELLVKAWTKACFEDRVTIIQGDLDARTLWFFQYVRALVCLTNSRRHDFCETSVNIVKALHTLLNMAKSRTIEFKLIMFDFFFYLIEHEVYDENKINIDNLIVETFKHLVQSTDYVVRFKLFCSLKIIRRNKGMDKMINIFGYDKLKQIWNSDIKSFRCNSEQCKEKLMKVSEDAYTHKCFENKDFELRDTDNVCDFNRSTGNFDLADDVDALFEIESESEPVCKKVKFNNDDGKEVDVIIAKLENDVSKLSEVKENVFSVEQKHRIRDACFKLKNIIH